MMMKHLFPFIQTSSLMALSALLCCCSPSEESYNYQLDLPEASLLPAEIVLKELKPARSFAMEADQEGKLDAYHERLISSFETAGTADVTITPSIPSLAEMSEKHPALLRQYLACHPGWWLHSVGHQEFAIKRWLTWGTWEKSRNGYLSSFGGKYPEKFQFRTCIGLSGSPMLRKVQKLTAGQSASVRLTDGNHLYESQVSWGEAGSVVELFEQSEAQERRLTKAAIRELEVEFSALMAAANDDGDMMKLLPPHAINPREEGDAPTRLEITGSAGRYRVHLWGNPGELGHYYLKAFEISEGTQLSTRNLELANSEIAGWSTDTTAMFHSSFEAGIYEGKPGKHYGARIEVWFVPDSGSEERKVLTENWRLEGYEAIGR